MRRTHENSMKALRQCWFPFFSSAPLDLFLKTIYEASRLFKVHCLTSPPWKAISISFSAGIQFELSIALVDTFHGWATIALRRLRYRARLWLVINHSNRRDRFVALKASCNLIAEATRGKCGKFTTPSSSSGPIRHYLNVLFIFFRCQYARRRKAPLIWNKLLPFYVYEFGG